MGRTKGARDKKKRKPRRKKSEAEKAALRVKKQRMGILSLQTFPLEEVAHDRRKYDESSRRTDQVVCNDNNDDNSNQIIGGAAVVPDLDNLAGMCDDIDAVTYEANEETESTATFCSNKIHGSHSKPTKARDQ